MLIRVTVKKNWMGIWAALQKLTALLVLYFCSPGVTVTNLHKRSGMNGEDYAKVGCLFV